MIGDNILKGILELCAEDYYGLWELYWNYEGTVGKENVDDAIFIEVLKQLIDENKIAAYDKNRYTEGFNEAAFCTESGNSERVRPLFVDFGDDGSES